VLVDDDTVGVREALRDDERDGGVVLDAVPEALKDALVVNDVMWD
jgi:hypothetical protein